MSSPQAAVSHCKPCCKTQQHHRIPRQHQRQRWEQAWVVCSRCCCPPRSTEWLFCVVRRSTEFYALWKSCHSRNSCSCSNKYSRARESYYVGRSKPHKLLKTHGLAGVAKNPTVFLLTTTLPFGQYSSPWLFMATRAAARVLPACPFSTCDTPEISRHPHLEGEPCNKR